MTSMDLTETAHLIQPMLKEVLVQLLIAHVGKVVVNIDGDGKRTGSRSSWQLQAEYQATRKREEA